MSDVVLSVPVDAGGVDPLLASLEKINENLNQINASSKGSFELMAKSLDKTNKKLKETDKTFGEIFKKIKLSGLMKMGAGVLAGGAGLVGISTGALLFRAFNNPQGTIASQWTGAGLGMSLAEQKALQGASKLTMGDENKLTNALTGIVTALNRSGGSAAFSNLGLSQSKLLTMKPEKALEEVFNAVKEKGKGMGREFARDAFMSLTGLSDIDFNSVVKQGASFGKAYDKMLAAYSDVNWDALAKGAESLILFQTQLDIVSDQIGGDLAGPLADVLTKLTPTLKDFGKEVEKFLKSITQEDIDNFVKNAKAVFDFVGGVASGLATGLVYGPESKEYGAKSKELLSKGNLPAAVGLAASGVTQHTATTLGAGLYTSLQEGMWKLLTDEGRAKMMKEWGEQFKSDPLWGPILSGKSEGTKSTVDVNITLKDESKKVNKVESAVASGGVKKPTSPLRPVGQGGS